MVAPIHDRMPAIFSVAQFEDWLHPSEGDAGLLEPWPADWQAFTRRGGMGKEQKTREELEEMIQAELAAVPECHGVRHVSIVLLRESYPIEGVRNVYCNWERSDFINFGEADSPKCMTALRAIMHRLQTLYDLVD